MAAWHPAARASKRIGAPTRDFNTKLVFQDLSSALMHPSQAHLNRVPTRSPTGPQACKADLRADQIKFSPSRG